MPSLQEARQFVQRIISPTKVAREERRKRNEEARQAVIKEQMDFVNTLSEEEKRAILTGFKEKNEDTKILKCLHAEDWIDLLEEPCYRR